MHAFTTAVRTPLLFLAVVLAGASCTGSPTACTQIGCDDGLNVELTGALPASYTVTVRSGATVLATAQCSPAVDCRGLLFFPGVTAPQVQVEVTGAGVDVRRDVTPVYTTSRPNGPGCPPVCRQARVQIAVQA